MEDRKKLTQCYLSDSQFIRIREIAIKNNLPKDKPSLVSLALDIVDKVSYSEDFKDLTDL
jgi:hypothetical protein